jgi:hypothetical protein
MSILARFWSIFSCTVDLSKVISSKSIEPTLSVTVRTAAETNDNEQKKEEPNQNNINEKDLNEKEVISLKEGEKKEEEKFQKETENIQKEIKETATGLHLHYTSVIEDMKETAEMIIDTLKSAEQIFEPKPVKEVVLHREVVNDYFSPIKEEKKNIYRNMPPLPKSPQKLYRM